MSTIKVAIVGVGNCCSALIQGVKYYSLSRQSKNLGLMTDKIGKYNVKDIDFVAAVDVNCEKVGKDLSEAIFQNPNNTPKFSEVPKTSVIVRKGPILDGLGKYAKEKISTDSSKPENIVSLLQESDAEILVNLLPTGAVRASKFYAEEALKAGCSFINATPTKLASDPYWQRRYKLERLQLAGDDIKNQVGATILHEAVLSTLARRGVRLKESYQLDIGGGMESLNALEKERYWIKRKVKIGAVSSSIPYKFPIVAGSSDYVEFMKNSRTSHFWIKGEYFGKTQFNLDMTLEVVEGPACAAVLVDVIRGVKLAKERKTFGVSREICSYAFKMPPEPFPFNEATNLFSSFASGKKR